MEPDHLTHSELRLTHPNGWVLYLSHEPPTRLVVFVHGFGGRAVRTWQQFPRSGEQGSWWRQSDLLFVGYPSHRDNITATADRLREQLPNFYPQLPQDLWCTRDVSIRDPSWSQYEELFLVGHSLGGLIVRRALSDQADEWLSSLVDDPEAAMPPLLGARVRLFSPASAGFRPGGFLGLLRAGPIWSLIEMKLRLSTAYTDLQPSSPILEETRTRTERAIEGAHGSDLKALRPDILWANPDQVVLTERYDTDRSSKSVDDTSHSSVCKPNRRYRDPWAFVETGSSR